MTAVRNRAVTVRRVYLDNNATTPVAPEVFEAMKPYLLEDYGNASSIHWFGQRAKNAVEKARQQVAKLLIARPGEVIFTSGGTEADNAAIFGIVQAARVAHPHIITTRIEHHAVLNTAQALEKQGVDVTYLGVGTGGVVDPADVRRAIRPETVLVSIMHANNEIGTIQPLEEIGAIAREHDIYFHTDAVQSAGKIPVDIEKLGVDLLSLSAHKLNGPKGVGALYVRRKSPRVQITAQMDGGGHERGMRSGTLNVPGIVGLGEACALCQAEMPAESKRMAFLRDKLRDKLQSELDETYINGTFEHRLPNNLNISFAYVEGESLLMGINEIAVSSGSACTSATLEPSYVLKALGAGDDLAHSSIRFGLGRFNTEEEVDYVAAKVIDVVKKLRELSPLYEMAKEGIDLSKVQWAAH